MVVFIFSETKINSTAELHLKALSYKTRLFRLKLSSTSEIDKPISTRYKANFIVLFLAVLTSLLSTYLFLELHPTDMKVLVYWTYLIPEYHLL